ncbi:MAG: substrate-binding domain-containing protein [Thermoanaerobaculia bacterium]|nr:substrate-binding domain-containing protein [Thermoanaerobaculia bacterium]
MIGRRETWTLRGVVGEKNHPLVSLSSCVVALCLGLAATPHLLAETPREDRSLAWAGCGISKHSFMRELAETYQEETGIEIQLAGGGATHGIRAVDAGKIDMGGSCRHALDYEEEKSPKLIPIAWDALVVVVHPDNPVGDIRHEQLAAIYSGEITRWRQLESTAPDEPIRVYAREGKISGVGYMSRIMLFSDPERDYAATHWFRSSGPLETALQNDPFGIALTGISSALRRDLKLLELDGVRPSEDSLLAGTYRFARPLFLVVPPEGDNPDVEQFVRWARSESGQSAIKDTGAVPVNDITLATWNRYRDFMAQAHQDLSALERILSELTTAGQDG